MQKIVGIGLLVACTATSFAAVRFHKEASQYRTQLAAVQEEAIKLKRDLALSAKTVRVYEPATPVPTETAAPTTPDTQAVTEAGSSDLQMRDLELQIQEKNRLIAALQQQKQAEPAPEARPQGDGQNRQNWEEELKKSDPERYQEMIKQREEAKSKIQRAFAEKADHFLKQDTAAMTEDQAMEHDQMLQTLESTWQLAEQLQNGETPRDQRWQIMRQMRDNINTLEPAMKEERTKEWYKLSDELGYKGDDATAFVNYLDKIVNVTSMTDIYQSMRRNGRGGGWGGNSSNTTATTTTPAR